MDQLVLIGTTDRLFKTVTRLQTLETEYDPDSIFDNLARKIRRKSYQEDILPEIDVKADGYIFSFIMDYLRNGQDAVLPTDDLVMEQLSWQAQLFRLHSLLHMQGLRNYGGLGHSSTMRQAGDYVTVRYCRIRKPNTRRSSANGPASNDGNDGSSKNQEGTSRDCECDNDMD